VSPSLNDVIYNSVIEKVAEQTSQNILLKLKLYIILSLFSTVSLAVLIKLKNRGKIDEKFFKILFEEVFMVVLIVSNFALLEILLYLGGVLYA